MSEFRFHTGDECAASAPGAEARRVEANRRFSEQIRDLLAHARRQETMPHYADGSEAKVGDVVKGTTYNRPGTVIGLLTSITPGTESCNCQVTGALRVLDMDGRRTVIPDGSVDYGETKAFQKVA